MHRLRLNFSRGDKLKFLSHLDLMRLWERALRRAGMAPAYSEGFSPHPRISLAAPLPVGVTSSAEMMDIFLGKRVTPGSFVQKVAPQLPEGISITDISPVSLQAPSLQSRVRLAEYVAVVQTDRSKTDLEAGLADLMAKQQLSWHHARDTGEKYYDLRALIDGLWLAGVKEGGFEIGMRLRCGPLGSGRPEQVTMALGFDRPPLCIERTKLIFD